MLAPFGGLGVNLLVLVTGLRNCARGSVTWRDTSYSIAELVKRGYDVVPVNPSCSEVDGRPAFATVKAVTPPVEAALVMTPQARALEVAADCLEAGVRQVWFHRGAGPGSGSPEAVALCVSKGVQPVTGLCPFMALEGASWFHRAHGFFRGAKRLGAGPPLLPATTAGAKG